MQSIETFTRSWTNFDMVISKMVFKIGNGYEIVHCIFLCASGFLQRELVSSYTRWPDVYLDLVDQGYQILKLCGIC